MIYRNETFRSANKEGGHPLIVFNNLDGQLIGISAREFSNNEHFPRFLFSSLAEEQPYGTFLEHDFNFGIMTTVVSAVFYCLLSLQFCDYGLGRQVPP